MTSEQLSPVLKAMADPKRIKIIELLATTTNSLCACQVLEHFDFTQPTLSHHMKVLAQAGIVSVSKKGQWHHYTLRPDFATEFIPAIASLLSVTERSN